MSLGAVVAMEMQKYSEGGIDMFDCAMKEFMEQTNLEVRATGTATRAVAQPLTCLAHLWGHI